MNQLKTKSHSSFELEMKLNDTPQAVKPFSKSKTLRFSKTSRFKDAPSDYYNYYQSD